MITINKYVVYGLILGALASLLPGISGKQGEEPRLKILANMVLVRNTGECNNKCVHIHHWMWLGALLLFTSYISCKDSWITQFLLGVWASSAVSELLRYSDALQIRQKCFPGCDVSR